MAEMTAAEAVKILPRRKMLSYKLDGKSVNTILLTEDEQCQIAALLERQAAELVEAQATIDTHNELLTTQAAEIAKKDRMIRAACGKLGAINDELLSCRTCCWMKNCKDQPSCADCWLAWLEKEAEEPND